MKPLSATAFSAVKALPPRKTIYYSGFRNYSMHLGAGKQAALVPNRSLLSVTGSQASSFLNGLITTSIPPPESLMWNGLGGGVYSAFLTPQGRIMHDVLIYPYIPSDPSDRPGYIIEYDPRAANGTSDAQSSNASASPKHPIPTLPSMMKRYILRSKVRLRDVSQDWDLWAVWGGDEPAIVRRRPDDWKWGRSGAVEPVYHPIDASDATANDSPSVIRWLLGDDHSGRRAIWLADRRAPEMGVRLLLPKGEKPSPHFEFVPSDKYTLHRVKLGVPEGFDDMPGSDSFPMDHNMDVMGGVDFRKGCYVGQELTVRTYHTGVIRKRTFPVEIKPESDGSSAPGYPTPQTPVQATWASSEVSRPRPRGPGKLLTTTPDGWALALLRSEVAQATEQGAMSLSVEGPNASKFTLAVRRPAWWPTEPKEG